MLIVDDDASIRLLCRINLELDGYRAVEAATVADARDAVAAGGVDVVLLDRHLGGADGFEFADELRRRHPDLGIVLMTGSADSIANDVPADGVLPKPFDLDALRGMVSRLAARSI